MNPVTKQHLLLGAASVLLAAGCASTPPTSSRSPTPPSVLLSSKPQTHDILPVTANTEPLTPTETTGRVRPAYAKMETLPIDLPTVIRLVDENSPAIGIAHAKVQEAQAKLANAETQWLPNLSVGVTYNRFDGQTQNQAGNVFGVSRANLFPSAGPALSLDLAEAIYRPLIERRLTSSEQLREQSTRLGAELDAVMAYLDLLQVHSQLDINADVLQKTEEMLSAARDVKVDRTTGDVHRAQIEVLQRRTDRLELTSRAGAASARLARLLLLPPNVKLVPADGAIVPVTLIDPASTIDDLLATALANRPDLASNREAIAAAWAKVRRQERGPIFPKITVANQTGLFGGGLNDDLARFEARNALGVQFYWEVKNLGFGNRSEAAERKAILSQANFQLVEAQAKASMEIVEAAQMAAAKHDSLELAERAVREASELYRIQKELPDPLRPMQAIQVLNQTQQSYLTAVIEFNRAQYRLYTALGNPMAGSDHAVRSR
ncbi:MAG: TolC family protein [Fimbriiglobus sp.]